MAETEEVVKSVEIFRDFFWLGGFPPKKKGEKKHDLKWLKMA